MNVFNIMGGQLYLDLISLPSFHLQTICYSVRGNLSTSYIALSYSLSIIRILAIMIYFSDCSTKTYVEDSVLKRTAVLLSTATQNHV